jgi:hypothetical protein
MLTFFWISCADPNGACQNCNTKSQSLRDSFFILHLTLRKQALGGSMQNKKATLRVAFLSCCDPAGIRTQDPYIKSVMLYQLSYGIIQIVKIGAQIYHDYLIYKNYFGLILCLNLV